MTLTFHALWMLCALASSVHAARAARRFRDLAAFAAGFAIAAIVMSPQRLPDPAWVGVLSAIAAMVLLFRPTLAIVASAWGGALGGMLTAMIEVQGLPPVAAVAPPALLAAIAAWQARFRPGFAPDILLDEAFLGVCLLGLVVSIAPGVIDGWQAAANLTIEPATPGPVTVTPMPVWTIALVGTATALGAVYSLWSRR